MVVNRQKAPSRHWVSRSPKTGVDSKGARPRDANCQLLIAADYILYKIKHATIGNKHTVNDIKVKKCRIFF